jgi:hypothetical protein
MEVKTVRATPIDDYEEEDNKGESPLYLTEVFGAIVGQPRFSDCTFVVGKGKERIPVHRLVLAVNSPVFAVTDAPLSHHSSDTWVIGYVMRIQMI